MVANVQDTLMIWKPRDSL